MRIGRRRLPRRRDPRRRFRNRLLVGMVGVALLPLVAFAVLAVFELDTIAKSTANATESAILQRQQLLLDRAIDRSAGQLDSGMADIDAAVSGLIGAFAKAKDGIPASATLPAETFSPLGADYQSVSAGGSTLILPVGETAGKATPDARFVLASENKAFVTQVQAVFKLAAINSVWLEDPSTEAIRAFRAFTPSTTYATHPYDPAVRDRSLNYSEGGTDSGHRPECVECAGRCRAQCGRAILVGSVPAPRGRIHRGQRVVPGWSGSFDDPDRGRRVARQADGPPRSELAGDSGPLGGERHRAGVVRHGLQGFPQCHRRQPDPAPAAGPSDNPRPNRDDRRDAPSDHDQVQQGRTDLFTAPVYSGHWIVLEPIPVSSLEPNLSALTIGINDSVHRLFPVTVLPVLILLVALAFIATTLLSRRMYLPVRALTDHAVLEERTRLAREIHDTLAQQLTGIVLELEAADALLNRGSEQRAKTSVEKARELARGALQEARRSVWNLRPAPLSATGLVAAIGHEVEAWEERTGIPARFKARAVPPHPPLSPTAEVALLRIGQEALSNAARHGHPEHVDVELRAHAQELILSIRDDGIGFDPAASAPREDCFGLDGMAERARNAGGTLTVVSTPGQGTTITTRLPFTEAVPEAVSA